MGDLVIGGTGFLGPHVVEALVARGRHVTVAARRRPRAEHGLPAGAAFLEVDGEQPGALAARVASGEFRRVLHLAALSRVDQAEADPERALRLNCHWPSELASAADAASCAFVWASTDLVFGGRAPLDAAGFGPTEAPSPIGAYGTSKAAGEAAILERNPAALVVRLPLLFGDSRGRGLGARDGLFAALDRGESPQLFRDELRSPLDTGAAAAGLLALVDMGCAGIWHLGGRAVSRFELGRALCLAAGRDPARLRSVLQSDLGLAGRRAADARLDSRATRELGSELDMCLDSGGAPVFPESSSR